MRHARLAPAKRAGSTAVAHPRGGRSGQPDHPGHARGGRGHPADGLRRRPDGPVHAADSGRRVGGDGLLARRRLRRDAVGGGAAPEARAAHATSTARRICSTRLYRRVMGPLIASGRLRGVSFSGVAALLLLAAMALVPLGLVTVKMLPFDNKSEFQVIVDMPEGTALETTARGRRGAGRRPRWTIEPSSSVQQLRRARRRRTTSTASCVTTSCAAAPHLADLQVNLVAKGRARRAEPRRSRSACATRLAADRATGSARRCRWPRCRRDRPCCRRWSPRSTGRTPSAGSSVARSRSRRSSSRRRAWSTPTGTSRRAAEGHAASWIDDEKAAPRGVCRQPDVASRACGWPARARRRAAARRAGARGRADRPAPAARRLAARSRRVAVAAAGRAGRPVARRRADAGRVATDERTRASITRTCRPVTYVTADLAGQRREPGLRHPRR